LPLVGCGLTALQSTGLLDDVVVPELSPVVLRRQRWRDDLVLVAAVLLGAMSVAVVGVTLWGLLAGIVLGVAVPIAALALLPAPLPQHPATEPQADGFEAPSEPVHDGADATQTTPLALTGSKSE
jgi:hypothetical protein